jgi:hypothetical protein
MKGANAMDPILSQHIHKLISDSQDVKKVLEILEKDHGVWDRKREKKGLEKFIERVKGLENDIGMIMGDCLFFTSEADIKVPMKDLHRAFALLNDLFQDLKKARLELNQAYIHPAELKQLEIDCGRFKKTIDQALKHLFMGDKNLSKGV